MHTEPQRIRISDYTYELPDDRIAKYPAPERDESKLLVYENGIISLKKFHAITDLIRSGDMLVFNRSKVIQARLMFRKSSGASIEIFCLSPSEGTSEEDALNSMGQSRWTCMVRGLKKWKNETLKIHLSQLNTVLSATLKGRADGETAEVDFEWDNSKVTFAELLSAVGELPIPPYLNRKTETSDLDRYQTVYAQNPGSVAAPTAGLHFTEKTLAQLEANGALCESIVLHVGAGTFLPVKSDNMGEHNMHSETIEISVGFMHRLAKNSGRLIAVGTTSVRSLESLYWWCAEFLENKTMLKEVGQWSWLAGKTAEFRNPIGETARQLSETGIEKIRFKTRLIITPGYDFQVVKGMVTNFHQPGSTLLLLVAAFVGQDWRDIYSFALQNDFRFLSFGDSSILLQENKKL